MRSGGAETNVITNVEDLYSDHEQPDVDVDPTALTKSKRGLDRVASHLIIDNKNKPKDQKKPWMRPLAQGEKE